MQVAVYGLICVLAAVFEHIELPAKLLDYFLRRNKSNIDPILVCWRLFCSVLEPHWLLYMGLPVC